MRAVRHRSRWVLAAAALAVIAACGSGGTKASGSRALGASVSTTQAPGSPGTLSSDSPTSSSTTTGATAASPGTTGPSSGVTSSGPRTTSAVKGGSGPAPAGPTSTVAGARTTSPPAHAAVGTAPGRYTYDDSGTTSGGAPTTTRPVSAKTHLVVDPATGDTQHSTQTTDGVDETQEQIYRFQPSTVYLADLKLSGALAKEFKPAAPGVVATPLPPAGHWSWDMSAVGDPGTTAHGDFAYVGAEPVQVAGQTYPTSRIDGTVTIKSSYNGTPITVKIQETQWLSTTYLLPLREHMVTDTTYGVSSVGHSDTTSTVESVKPSAV